MGTVNNWIYKIELYDNSIGTQFEALLYILALHTYMHGTPGSL
jgi:hypothetical protein